jgi:hypothetical protein
MQSPRHDRVPSARVFREAGKPARPLPIPLGQRARRVLDPVGRGAMLGVRAAVGMWPLTAIMLMAAALLIAAGNVAAP